MSKLKVIKVSNPITILTTLTAVSSELSLPLRRVGMVIELSDFLFSVNIDQTEDLLMRCALERQQIWIFCQISDMFLWKKINKESLLLIANLKSRTSDRVNETVVEGISEKAKSG